MTYELAKQLKDAGFPQPDGDSPIDFDAYAPTLSELIEACGQQFDSLFRVSVSQFSAKSNKQDKGGWEALSIYSETADIWEWGKTPEEAVAKLWLELNRK